MLKMLGDWLERGVFRFVTWVLVVFILLAVFAFFQPEQWFKASEQVRSRVVLLGLVFAAIFVGLLLLRWIWKRRKAAGDR